MLPQVKNLNSMINLGQPQYDLEFEFCMLTLKLSSIQGTSKVAYFYDHWDCLPEYVT